MHTTPSRTLSPFARQSLPNVIQSVAKNPHLKKHAQQSHVKMYRSTAGDVSLNAQQDVHFFYLYAPDDPTFHAHHTLPNAHSSRTSIPLDRHSERSEESPEQETTSPLTRSPLPNVIQSVSEESPT